MFLGLVMVWVYSIATTISADVWCGGLAQQHQGVVLKSGALVSSFEDVCVLFEESSIRVERRRRHQWIDAIIGLNE